MDIKLVNSVEGNDCCGGNRKGRWQVAILNRAVRVGFTEVTSEQTLEGNESVIQIIWRTGAFQAKEKSVEEPSGTNMPDVFKKQQED